MSKEQRIVDNSDGFLTPGSRLKKIREAAKLTREVVADELRISVAKVEALETDQYEQVKSDTFVRGYLRSYAKLLEIDAEQLVKEYNDYLSALSGTARQVSTPKEAPKEAPVEPVADSASAEESETDVALESQSDEVSVDNPQASAASEQGSVLEEDTSEDAVSEETASEEKGTSTKTFVIAILFFLALWVVAATVLNDDDSTPVARDVHKSTVPVDEVVVKEAVVESETVETGAVEKGTGEKGSELESLPAQQENTVEGAAQANSVQNSAEEQPVVQLQTQASNRVGTDSLTLSFTDECWVEISDALGDVLFTDIQQAGDTLTLSGSAPFEIMLGNASEVSILLNEKAVDVPVENDRKTLRFSLGRQNL